MSCYEWESGTLALPTSEVAAMRKALNVAHTNQMKSVKALLDRLWPELKKLPADKRRRLDPYSPPLRHLNAAADDEAWWDLHSLFHASGGRKPTAEHWKKSLAYPSTNRTSDWRCGEASVSLEGRHLTWDVPENNHAVDHAHDSWLGRALFAQLDRVKWTRGSGGYFVGNNEYNADDCSPGGGGNYLTSTYGPAGEKTRKAHSGFVAYY